MAAESTSHGGTVPSEEVPGPETWLIKILNEEHARLTEKTGNQADGQPRRPMTPIQKADEKLRESKETCFEPEVVSLGPFHHGKPGLEDMESYKKVSAVWFISLVARKPANEVTGDDSNVYQKFKNAVTFSPYAADEVTGNESNVSEKFKNPVTFSLRDCYAGHKFFHEPKFRSDSEDLMPMMFLDGCFILHFIHRVVNGRSADLSNTNHQINQKQIVRDMFLLENQIPYQILTALMSLLPEKKNPRNWIMKFILIVFLPPIEFNFSEIRCWRRMFAAIFEFVFSTGLIRLGLWDALYHEDNEPLHLLDLLRAVLVGAGASPDHSSHGSGYWNYYFRPITELKAAGIQVSRGHPWMLKEVKFRRHPINSHLVLPQIVVDDSTETLLLNLLAYEKCPDGPLDRTVTSYICLLDSLIQNAEDVKELQCEKILLNRLGSKEKVDELFKNLATNVSPNYNVYNHVIDDIKEHYWRHFNRERVQIGQWMSQFIHTYFTTPWTVISLIAAILLLFLTLLQTIYTMLGFYET